MSEQFTVVTAYLRPKPGASERLLALRPELERDFATQLPGFVSATLLAVDGTEDWRDIVVLSNPAGAEAGVASEAYREWSTLVDLTGHDVCERLSYSTT